ncbi:hypothetical protein UG55_103014 [Frankia sp. EI5c]|uniref:hypothetical protein n=1 Tax=Frankia sp. EI5c TaxID=683316 RepID=UPI0007C2C72D|nr:hypothetical protein [Frankia sp. EI5c]OAA24370.1 hypothetical protein UG55_103014 [Frankia sp. EI5c]
MGGIRRRRGALRAVSGGIAAAALAVTVAGCQEGTLTLPDTAAPTASAPAATGPAAPSERPTGAPARELRANDYLLTAGPETADFERSGAAGQSEQDSSMRAEVAACVGVPGYDPPPPSDEATGDRFANIEESDFTASSRAKILPAEQIRQDAEIVTNPRFGDCFRGSLEEQLAGAGTDDISYEIVAVETPTPPRGVTALVRTSLGISDQYDTYGYVYDTFYFYVGRVAVELTVINVQNVPPRTIEQGFIDQIAEKLTHQ